MMAEARLAKPRMAAEMALENCMCCFEIGGLLVSEMDSWLCWLRLLALGGSE